ncbi:MAG: type II toxin-antitoxin system RelE/ParE family toxin [Polyangiaceae bacterium]|nr:type II toxin-antitoxin system RelE/ParE family toxin [Polyangiaceae bacterium]
MAVRLLPEARDDLREAVKYYRKVSPPVLGKQLAQRVLAAFRECLEGVASAPNSRPLHPDIPGVRFVGLRGFPYIAFYAVHSEDVVVVAVEYATSDYESRVAARRP